MMNPTRTPHTAMKRKPIKHLEQWHSILEDRWQETLQAIEERSSQPPSYL